MFRPSPSISRSVGRAFAALSIVATLATSAPATAALVQNNWANGSLNVTLNQPFQSNQSTNVGGFTGVFNGAAFLSYCIELTQQFSFGTSYSNYSVVPVVSAPASLPMGAAKAMDLALLVGQNFTDSFTSTVKTVAMQLAIWEIIYETGAYNVENGAFNVNASGGDVNSARTQANLWLSQLGNVQGSMIALSSPDRQDFITTVVPVPTSAALLAGGLLFGLWGTRRRQA